LEGSVSLVSEHSVVDSDSEKGKGEGKREGGRERDKGNGKGTWKGKVERGRD
jgi:hypothetical protein